MSHLAVFHVGEGRPPVLVLQFPGIDTGDFVLAAPLYPATAAKPIEVITPRVNLNGEAYLVGIHLMASIRARALETQIGSLLDEEYAIQRALSRLFFGT